MPSPHTSLAVRALTWLSHAVWRWPRLSFTRNSVLFGLAVYYTIPRWSSSAATICGGGQEVPPAYLAFRKSSGADDLVAIIESEDTRRTANSLSGWREAGAGDEFIHGCVL